MVVFYNHCWIFSLEVIFHNFKNTENFTHKFSPHLRTCTNSTIILPSFPNFLSIYSTNLTHFYIKWSFDCRVLLPQSTKWNFPAFELSILNFKCIFKVWEKKNWKFIWNRNTSSYYKSPFIYQIFATLQQENKNYNYKPNKDVHYFQIRK